MIYRYLSNESKLFKMNQKAWSVVSSYVHIKHTKEKELE